ncbi:MAG: signal recognition particle-docking protein FtsY [Prevotellaceae bacterium]|jgi:fused signal recognition particle receptor|nr:signal recognition particle-docking protein FtsY [Prevotellaceae bacterium]
MVFGFIKKVFKKEKLDAEVSQNLEDYLLSSDFGYETTQKIMETLKKENKNSSLNSAQTKDILKEQLKKELAPLETNFELKNKPTVLLFLGINGAGKTTVLAKLANHYQKQGKSVIIGAADTFRASATEQLEEWAKRLKADFISAPNSDPASVAYKTYKQAIDEGKDVVLIDTAGRLTNNDNLMNELKKIYSTLQKLETSVIAKSNGDVAISSICPILVLDGTAGQNSINQVEKFSEFLPIKGLIINKMDSSSKAGFVFQLAQKSPTPILFLGNGEKLEDLQPFTANTFLQDF